MKIRIVDFLFSLAVGGLVCIPFQGYPIVVVSLWSLVTWKLYKLLGEQPSGT